MTNIANVSQADIIANDAFEQALYSRMVTSTVALETASVSIRELICEGLTGLEPASTIFIRRRNALAISYAVGRVMVRANVTEAKARELHSLRNYNASKCVNGLQAGMRPKEVHQYIRTAESTFSGWLSEEGFADETKAGNRQGTKATPATPAVTSVAPAPEPTTIDKATPALDANGNEVMLDASGEVAPVIPPAFKKSYNGFSRLEAIAAELSKAMRECPNEFQHGAFACAADIVNLVKAMVVSHAADKAQAKLAPVPTVTLTNNDGANVLVAAVTAVGALGTASAIIEEEEATLIAAANAQSAKLIGALADKPARRVLSLPIGKAAKKASKAKVLETANA